MTDDVQARLRAYARLLVRAGVNLTEGQELLVHAQHEHAPFVRAIAEEAYAAGARYVDVAYADRWVQRAFVETAPDEMLGWTPPWMVARLERAIEVGAAVIGVSADSGAEVFEGLDGDRLARARFRDFDRVWMDGVMGRKLAWSLVAYPDRGLGARGAGRAGRRPPVGRLRARPAPRRARPRRARGSSAWTSCRPARASSPSAGSPRCATAAPGTDLEVGLIEGARWMAGRERTVHGQVHAPNLPTEEVFTSPHRERAEGTVRSTMPLALRGTIVEGLELRVAGGRDRRGARDAAARTPCAPSSPSTTARAASARSRSSTPRRASARPASPSTTRSSTRTPPPTSPGATRMPWALDHLPADQHAAAGLNESATHTDFMVGAPGGRDRRGRARRAPRWRCCAAGIWQLRRVRRAPPRADGQTPTHARRIATRGASPGIRSASSATSAASSGPWSAGATTRSPGARSRARSTARRGRS